MVLLNCQSLSLTELSPQWTDSTKFIGKAKVEAGNHSLKRALELFHEQLKSNSAIRPSSYRPLLQEFSQQRLLSGGLQLHAHIVKTGLQTNPFLQTGLLDLYCKCESLEFARRVFDANNSETASPVTWNSIIARLVDHGHHADGFEIYEQMLHVGTNPTPLTFSSLLKSCAGTGSLSLGQQIHSQVMVRGFSPNMILESALVDVYAKCGELENGRQVFERMEERNVVTWNTMIRGYSQVGDSEQALKLFGLMRREDIVPDKFTFPALLTGACSGSYLHGEFKSIHAYAVKVGLERDCFIGSSLIAMYSTNNHYDNARLAFDDISSKDAGVWSSIISASVKTEGEEALELFADMLNSNFQPNQFIYSSLLAACGEISILEAGKQVHAHSLKSNDAVDTATQNSLIAMYSNCGCLQEAWRVFDTLENPNLVSFNSMISACAQHGHPSEAAELFARLKLLGLRPDEITALNLLSAFNHAGLVHKGLELFNSMVEEDQGVIEPGYQHYACIVDMLSRAGKIDEAMRFLCDMPFKPDSSLWRIVLGACSKHRNLQVGKQVADLLLELEPYEATNYILLANTYARSGRWVEAERLRHLMKDRRIEKEVGFSWIEINKETHTFGVEDRSHPLTGKIYERLQELIREIKATGYVPDISFTVHDMEDDRREESLYYHSEKLAFAFGDLFAAQGVNFGS